jgi:hypothetical protein
MSSFGIYLIGFVLIVGGVAYGLTLAGVPTTWVIVVAVVLIGLGVITGVSRTKRPDPPA